MMARYAVLGEADSDAETLKVLIRRLCGNERLSVKTKGYDGCGDLLRKGARDLRALHRLGWDRFVVAFDADRHPPEKRRAEVHTRVILPSGVASEFCCITVPVQEIEAWLLADIGAVEQIWPAWRPSPVLHPETIENPKELLEALPRRAKLPVRYSHAKDNPRLAAVVELERVLQRCPSFRGVAEFVRAGA